MKRSLIDRLDSDGVLSSSSLGLLACVSHEPAARHEAVPVDLRVTWAEVRGRHGPSVSPTAHDADVHEGSVCV